MNKRQLGAQETRSKLIAAALEILKDKVFTAINVEEITQKAGVSKGTFYVYFKRKEDVVLEISRTLFEKIALEFEKKKNEPLLEKLSFYFRNFMECVELCGINTCRQWTRDVLAPNTVPVDKDPKKWLYDVEELKNLLEKSIQNNELKADTPFETLTHILICELYGMMTCWCMSDGKFEPLDWCEKFCDVQLKKIFEPYLK